MERTLVRDGKELKYGYTTGTCATGAALAAVMLLETGEAPQAVTVLTPKGWSVVLEVLQARRGDDWAEAAIRKDAGDDPDVTHKHLIVSRVQRNDHGTVLFKGGTGVGTVTKPGLQIAVGEPAINPVPRKMMENILRPYIRDKKGFTVTVSVPEGAETALKTFNPRLGIVGGISIIGTSGIVEPMSEEALKESLALDLSMKKAAGLTRIVMTPGNYGRDIGLTLGISEEHVVKTSNFAGFMLDRASDMGFKEILWVGHLGKLVKVAAGIFQTHSSMADGRLETLAAWAGSEGASQELIRRVLNSNTTEEAVALLMEAGMESVFPILARRVSERSSERTRGQLTVGTILFTLDKGIIGMDEAGRTLLEAITHEKTD